MERIYIYSTHSKLWAEQIFGWYYFVERSVFEPSPDGHGGRYVTKRIKKRLINKQYLIVARGAAKSMYGSMIQNYFLNVDVTTTTSNNNGTNHETSGRDTITDSNSDYAS